MSTWFMCDYEIDQHGTPCGKSVRAGNDLPDGWYITDDLNAFGDYCPEHAKQVAWARIEREHHPDALVGPYLTVADAEWALENALLIAGLCEEDCLDAYVERVQISGPVKGVDVYLIDQNDSHHTGRI